MNNYNQNIPNPYESSYYRADSSLITRVMRRVYGKMTFGLVVTALVSWLCASSPSAVMYFVNNSWLMWVLLLAEVGLVIAISGAINKMSSGMATLLFYVFAVVNGLALWPIFAVYTGESLTKTFLICAGTFGFMSIYGYFTNRDLSRMGSLLFMALIGLIIASLVNIFLHSDTMGWIISFVGILIFVGLTAWDTQKIKQRAQMAGDNDSVSRLATLGALSLYLDFINLFLYLLRFFGDNRN